MYVCVRLVCQFKFYDFGHKIKDGGSQRTKVKPAKVASEKEAGVIKNDKDVSADDEVMADEENDDVKATKQDKKMDNGPVSAKASDETDESDEAIAPETEPTVNVSVPEGTEQALASKVAKIVASVKVEEQLIPNSMSPTQDSLLQKISAAFNRSSVKFTK